MKKLKNVSTIIGFLLLLATSLTQGFDETPTLGLIQAEEDAEIVERMLEATYDWENIMSSMVSEFGGQTKFRRQYGKKRLQNILNFQDQLQEGKYRFVDPPRAKLSISEAIKRIALLEEKQAEEDAKIVKAQEDLKTVVGIINETRKDKNIPRTDKREKTVSNIQRKFGDQQGKKRLQNILNFKRQMKGNFSGDVFYDIEDAIEGMS